MLNIAILESSGFFGIKLEKLIKSMGIDKVEIKHGDMLKYTKPQYAFKDSELIIMDMDHHDMDILDLVKQLKSIEDIKETPIIILSSHSDYKTLKEFILAGCSDFIIKPFLNSTFIEKVINWLPENMMDYHIDPQTVNAIDEVEGSDVLDNISNVKLTWSEDFEIGIESVDREHKGIVESFEKLYNFMKKGKGHEYYDELVSFLDAYVDTHFSHEEAIQASIGYPKFKEHHERHEWFKLQVKEIIETQNDKEVTNDDLIKISIFIKDWLIHHILMEDSDIGVHYKSRKQ